MAGVAGMSPDLLVEARLGFPGFRHVSSSRQLPRNDSKQAFSSMECLWRQGYIPCADNAISIWAKQEAVIVNSRNLDLARAEEALVFAAFPLS